MIWIVTKDNNMKMAACDGTNIPVDGSKREQVTDKFTWMIEKKTKSNQNQSTYSPANTQGEVNLTSVLVVTNCYLKQEILKFI